MFAEESLVKNDNSIEQIREKVWIPKRHPHVGGIELTPYCNLRCVHCYLQDQEKHTLLTTEEVKYIIDKLFDVGVLFLYFTGGEILTRSDFFEIYIYAKKKGFIIELLTNGTLIDSKAIEIFNKYPPASISISIYGKDEESYFRVTGQNGMYNKVINTLKMLSQNSIHFEIKYIGMRENQDDYPAICSLAERYGAEFSYSMELFPTLNKKYLEKKKNIDDFQKFRILLLIKKMFRCIYVIWLFQIFLLIIRAILIRVINADLRSGISCQTILILHGLIINYYLKRKLQKIINA